MRVIMWQRLVVLWLLMVFLDLTIGHYWAHVDLPHIVDRNLDTGVCFLIAWFASDKAETWQK